MQCSKVLSTFKYCDLYKYDDCRHVWLGIYNIDRLYLTKRWAIGATCKSLDKRMQQYQLRLYAIDVGLFEQRISYQKNQTLRNCLHILQPSLLSLLFAQKKISEFTVEFIVTSVNVHIFTCTTQSRVLTRSVYTAKTAAFGTFKTILQKTTSKYILARCKSCTNDTVLLRVCKFSGLFAASSDTRSSCAPPDPVFGWKRRLFLAT